MAAEEDEVHEVEAPIELNDDLEKRVADVFRIFDITGSNLIDIRDFGTVIRALGGVPTEAEVQELAMQCEAPGAPGSVHLREFLPKICPIFTEHRLQAAPPEELLEAFKVLDVENRGYLTREQVTSLFTEYGEPFTQEEIDELLEIAIDPHTQTVPYEYFINQLMHEPKPEDDTYHTADLVEAAKPPPPPPPRRFSSVMAELALKGASSSRLASSPKII